jgi:Fe-S-cluster-containing dehydrogenase component
MTVTRRSLLQGLAVGGAAAAVAGPAAAREPKLSPPDAVGMLYDATRCIGCRTCVTKCKQANELAYDEKSVMGGIYDAPSDLNGNTKNIIKVYSEGGKQSFMKMQCMHCADPACVSVCMAKALHKIERGVVAYDKNTCVGCRYCQVACAFNVPKFEWAKAVPQIVKCEMCRHRKEGPACAEVCPREAVIYGKLADLRREAHRRLERFPDRYEPKVYGEKDGGGTQVLYLSAAGIPFDKLGLPNLPSEPLPAMGETVQHTIYKGFIAPVVLYVALAVVQLRNRKKNEAVKPADTSR